MKDDQNERPLVISEDAGVRLREQSPPSSPAAGGSAPAPKRTPEDWAERLGHIKKRDKRIPQSETHPDWQHAAADKGHGWSKHAFHYEKDPLLITQADYEAALEAAASYPTTPLHEPAMSPMLKPKEKV